jgi:hypothetical protein
MKHPLTLLDEQIKATSLRKTAIALGISAPYLSDIMRRNRGIGPKVLVAMGLEKYDKSATGYRKTRKKS